jgi:predicted molibdopterin-dependent oxidoreductase YjgC
MSTTQMLQAAADGRIQALYLMGSNPLANYPDAALVRRALETVPFVIVQDILRSDLLDYADVVLPALTFAEREGTFTNTEGRVQFFVKAVEPIGSGRPDWEICAAILQALGVAPGVMNVDDVTRQIAEAIPEYQDAVPGKVPQDGVLLREERTQAFGQPSAPHAAAEGSAALPLILLTGDVLFDNGPLTRDTAAFQELQPGPWVEVSTVDAGNAGVADGDLVTVASEFDVMDVPARVRDWVQPGTVFVPSKVGVFHSNTLTSASRAVQRVRIARKAPDATPTLEQERSAS